MNLHWLTDLSRLEATCGRKLGIRVGGPVHEWHLAGDAVLKEAARRLTRAVRSYDSVGRYGGEEFLIVLPGCDRNQTVNTAERIRSEIGGTPVLAAGVEILFTLSIGATVAGPGAYPPTEVLGVADSALYQAKHAGRDRTVLV